MAGCLDICKICLRSDVTLIHIDKSLADYFASLTNFRLSHIDSRLCSECHHLLKKNYNFKSLCEKSSAILEKWIQVNLFEKTGTIKIPLNCLYKKVPQVSLQIQHQDASKIFNYSHIEDSNNDIVTDNNQDIVKQEIDLNNPDISSKDLICVKLEDVTNSFQQVLIQNDILNKSENDIDNYVTLNGNVANICLNDDDENGNLNEDDDEIKVYDSDVNDESYDVSEIKDDLSSDDECLAAKILRKKTHVNVNVKKDKTKKHNMSKKCKLNDLFVSHIRKVDEETNRSESKIAKKLKIMQKELSAIHRDWQKICLSELPQIPLTKYDMSQKGMSKSRKVSEDAKAKSLSVVSKLANISSDLDSIKDNCEKLISYKEGLLNPKESLRSELTAMFSSCGELHTEDGFVINKETILHCFDRVSECLMKRLWRFVHGKQSFDQRAINTLKHIQNKYQNEYQYETVFIIQYLNNKEKVAEEFEKRQTYACYINAKYKCELCYLGFKYETQMENHKQLHEETAGDFACPTCGVRHKSKKSLDTHSKSHEAVYKCKLCPLVTYYRYSMMNHFNQHEGVEYRCELCNTTFKSKSAYKTHVGLRHTEGVHTCTTCGRSLATQRALHWHIARSHKRGPQKSALSEPWLPVPCSVCGLKFASQHAYLRHTRSKHTTTHNASQKDGKGGTPKKKPIHTCRVCNAIGHSVGWLSLHFRAQHPDVDMALTYADRQPHLCEVCGKGYANVYNLRDHLSIHAGIRAHACPKCGARFHRAASLAQHMATHAPPRRACRVCGKRFRSHSNLNNHMRGHIGDRRYKCNLCGKGFLHRNALNEHVRGVHYKLRRARRKATDNHCKSNMTVDTSRPNMTLDTSRPHVSIDTSRDNNMTLDTSRPHMSIDTSRDNMTLDTSRPGPVL